MLGHQHNKKCLSFLGCPKWRNKTPQNTHFSKKHPSLNNFFRQKSVLKVQILLIKNMADDIERELVVEEGQNAADADISLRVPDRPPIHSSSGGCCQLFLNVFRPLFCTFSLALF
jgi:hypothetical protein